MSKNELSPIEKLNLSISEDIDNFMNNNFDVAPGYNVGGALQSAMYEIRNTKATGGKSALEVVGQQSIKNAIRQMVTQGLYPDKKQGYFIVYGSELTFMPSYLGYQMILKRDFGVKNVEAIVVYEGDEVKTEIVNGSMRVRSHIQARSPFETGATSKEKMIGAYAIATLRDGREKHEIMNMDQINAAWAMAQTKNVQNSFPDQMAKRTVLNRLAKQIISADVDENARNNMIMQSIYDADGYEMNENNPLNVDMKEHETTSVEPPHEELEVQEDVIIDVVESDDPF